MDIWAYYAKVDVLIADLRVRGQPELAARVEDAKSGGATAGETLGRLCLALPVVSQAIPELAAETNALVLWARDATA